MIESICMDDSIGRNNEFSFFGLFKDQHIDKYILLSCFRLNSTPEDNRTSIMTTSDGVTLRHPSMLDHHARLDVDTISILSSQSDSIQHLSYLESDDEGKGLVSIRTADSTNIPSSSSSSALKKDWIMYLSKTTNGNHDRNHNPSSSNTDDSENDLSSDVSENDQAGGDDDDDDDDTEQVLGEDPWKIDPVQREYYTKQFRNLQPDITNVINGRITFCFFIFD